jgi:hypothetical protein
MGASQLTLGILMIAALSTPFYAWAGSADERGEQGTTTKPASSPDPDCDHYDGLLSDRLFHLTL